MMIERPPPQPTHMAIAIVPVQVRLCISVSLCISVYPGGLDRDTGHTHETTAEKTILCIYLLASRVRGMVVWRIWPAIS